MTGSRRQPAAEPVVAGLVVHLRELHARMIEAVLGGEGLARVAEIAAQAAGAPVAICVPRRGAAEIAPAGSWDDPVILGDYVAAIVDGTAAEVPEGVAAQAPITSGDELIGSVLLLGDGDDVAPHSAEFLYLAAVASLTEVAVEGAREDAEENLRGAFLEDLRARPDLPAHDIVRRAKRLGCDIERGFVVLCGELDTQRPRHIVASVTGEHPGALAQQVEATRDHPSRVYAILPCVSPGEGEGEAETLARARKVAQQLGRYGDVGLSGFREDAAGLVAALQEAELVLDVRRHGDGAASAAADAGSDTYRLLFGVLASHPEEVHSFYEDTVASIVRYDEQYRSELAHTLGVYLSKNCNMNATARAIGAHRHTVAYRLERVKDLTGLDPAHSEDRERLGLGLKAHRIIAPRLPR